MTMSKAAKKRRSAERAAVAATNGVPLGRSGPDRWHSSSNSKPGASRSGSNSGNASANASRNGGSGNATPLPPPSSRMEKAFGDDDFIAFDLDMPAEGSGSGAAAKAQLNKGKKRQHDDESDDGDEGSGSSFGKGKTGMINARSAQRQKDGRDRNDRNDKRGQKRGREEMEDSDRGAGAGRAANRGTPWAADVDWAGCVNPAQALHREIVAFDRFLAPTIEEHETRKMVIELIRRGIRSKWKDAQVFSFGSQETQLYLPQGDIDLVCLSRSMEQQSSNRVLHSMASMLRQNNIAHDIQVIAKARVPIVKFTCLAAMGTFKVDISLNRQNGIAAADYVNRWLDRQPAVRPLVICIKCLLQQRGLSEVFSGGLGSFSVTLMVISFLQLHPKIQRKEIDPCENLGVLLLEFLELYGRNFGYDNVGITVRGDGGYFSKARLGWKDERRPFLLSIEDPLDKDNDISKSTFNILQIRQTLASSFDILASAACRRASDMRHDPSLRSLMPRNNHKRYRNDDEDARQALLEETTNTQLERDSRSLLGAIMGTSREVLRHRRNIRSVHQSGYLQSRLGKPVPNVDDPQPGPSSKSRRIESTPSAPRAVPSKASVDRLPSRPTSKRPSPAPAATEARQPETSRARPGSDSLAVMGADRLGRTPSAEIVDEAELADSQGFSFAGSNSKEDGGKKAIENADDAADSKYADPNSQPSKRPSRPTAPSSARQMPQRKAPGSQSSSDSFIDLDSTDEDSDANADDIGLPTIVSPQKAGGGALKGNKVSSKDRLDFWASKATASAGGSPYPDDEEGN